MYELLIGEIIAGICVCYALFSLNRLFIGNKLLQASQKLSGQMSKFKQEYPEFSQKPPEYVSNALGEIGIEGIMNELGIDPKLLNNPLVKGLIDKYAPKLIERLSKQGGGENEQTQTFGKGFM